MSQIPAYAEPVMQLRDAADALAVYLESDVQVEQPDLLVAHLRATAIALRRSAEELAKAAESAGHDPAAVALRRAAAGQADSAQALAEAVRALWAPRVLRD